MATGTADRGLLRTESLTGIHWLGVVLALVTGVLHLLLASFDQPFGLRVAFALAGLGFLGAVALFLIDYRRDLLYLVGIPFTAIQIVIYVVQWWPDLLDPLGVVDKVVQIALIAVLVILYRRG